MLYLISYDLIKPGKDYTALTDELKRLGAKRVLLSQWVVRRSNTNAEGLRDHFRSFIDTNDRLLVSEMEGGWASWNVMTDINKV